MQEVFLMISEMNDLATVISYKKIKQHHHYPQQRENFTSEWNERLHKWAERTSSQARLTGIGEDVKKTFGFEWRAAVAAWREVLRLRSTKNKSRPMAAWIFGGDGGSWTRVPERSVSGIYMLVLPTEFNPPALPANGPAKGRSAVKSRGETQMLSFSARTLPAPLSLSVRQGNDVAD